MKPIFLLGLAGMAALAVAAYFRLNTRTTPMSSAATSLYDFTMKDIDGKDQSLSQYKGKVLLVVNVASKCGFTPQYEGLEGLYTKLHDKGFEILGFPANQFASQEPGTDSEIKQFCTSKYSVTFPMFSKIVVKGQDASPLYQWLVAQTPNHNDIEWNFAKFVVGRDGKVLKRFSPQTKPDDKALVACIESALAN